MRLIDADAFRRELDNHWPFTKEEQSKHGIADMAKSTLLKVLYNMSTIEERKKGRWIKEPWHSDHVRQCSACHVTQTVTTYRGIVYFKFCPYCGADMRGENE